MGGLAAGGTAIVLSEIDGGGPGSGQEAVFAGPSQMDYEVAPFDQISTSGPQDLVITFGEELSVRSEGLPPALAQLEVVVENGRLLIRPKAGLFRGNWGLFENAKFFVTLPALKGIAMAGSGDVQVDRVEGESFEGTIGGSGEISIAELKVNTANFTVNGSGNITAAGTADQTRISIGGSGDVQAGGMRSARASIAIFGSGDVSLTVDEEAQVSITGSGDVNISGPGRCSVTKIGRSDVRCAGGGGDVDD